MGCAHVHRADAGDAGVLGTHAAAEPTLLARINAEGHEVGNHTFSHPDVDRVGELRLRGELESTTEVVASIIGRRPLLYIEARQRCSP